MSVQNTLYGIRNRLSNEKIKKGDKTVAAYTKSGKEYNHLKSSGKGIGTSTGFTNYLCWTTQFIVDITKNHTIEHVLSDEMRRYFMAFHSKKYTSRKEYFNLCYRLGYEIEPLMLPLPLTKRDNLITLIEFCDVKNYKFRRGHYFKIRETIDYRFFAPIISLVIYSIKYKGDDILYNRVRSVYKSKSVIELKDDLLNFCDENSDNLNCRLFSEYIVLLTSPRDKTTTPPLDFKINYSYNIHKTWVNDEDYNYSNDHIKKTIDFDNLKVGDVKIVLGDAGIGKGRFLSNLFNMYDSRRVLFIYPNNLNKIKNIDPECQMTLHKFTGTAVRKKYSKDFENAIESNIINKDLLVFDEVFLNNMSLLKKTIEYINYNYFNKIKVLMFGDINQLKNVRNSSNVDVLNSIKITTLPFQRFSEYRISIDSIPKTHPTRFNSVYKGMVDEAYIKTNTYSIDDVKRMIDYAKIRPFFISKTKLSALEKVKQVFGDYFKVGDTVYRVNKAYVITNAVRTAHTMKYTVGRDGKYTIYNASTMKQYFYYDFSRHCYALQGHTIPEDATPIIDIRDVPKTKEGGEYLYTATSRCPTPPIFLM